MGKFANGFLMVAGMLKRYPAMSAALLNVGVALAAYFGFHLTAEQLAGYISIVTVILGMLVHSNVIPLAKAEPPVTVVNNGPTGAPYTMPQRGVPAAGDATVTDLNPPFRSYTNPSDPGPIEIGKR